MSSDTYFFGNVTHFSVKIRFQLNRISLLITVYPSLTIDRQPCPSVRPPRSRDMSLGHVGEILRHQSIKHEMKKFYWIRSHFNTSLKRHVRIDRLQFSLLITSPPVRDERFRTHHNCLRLSSSCLLSHKFITSFVSFFWVPWSRMSFVVKSCQKSLLFLVKNQQSGVQENYTSTDW